jgi:hypothetical protein
LWTHDLAGAWDASGASASAHRAGPAAAAWLWCGMSVLMAAVAWSGSVQHRCSLPTACRCCPPATSCPLACLAAATGGHNYRRCVCAPENTRARNCRRCAGR